MIDNIGREINYIRISITDRCDLRCVYCMPEEGVEALAHAEILSFDEIARLCRIFASLGMDTVKLTGGEPLCRKGVVDLVKLVKSTSGVKEVTITTNGVALPGHWQGLMEAGLDAVNISIDTLDPGLYSRITRRDRLTEALTAIRMTAESGIAVKINCVPMCPEQKLWDVAQLAQALPVHVRFIEMMPIGSGKNYHFVSRDEIIVLLEAKFGKLMPCGEHLGNGPAEYYSIEGFKGRIGFISAVSHKFCHQCNRVRLTATGYLKTCLQYDAGVDLRALLRSGADDEAIKEAIVQAIHDKPVGHHFGEINFCANDDETHSMSQIGG